MDNETLSWVGAIGGSALGVLGGIIGTYFGIRNTNGPRERAFAVRASVMCWVGVTGFLAALWFTPMPYRLLLWLPYLLLLPFAIRNWNKRQSQIRLEEAGIAVERLPAR